MFRRIRHFLAPHDFAGHEEKTRKAYLLNVMTLSSIPGILLYVLLAPTERLAYVGFAAGVILIAWLAMRRGYVRPASVLLVGGIFCILVISVFTGGGVRAPAYSGFLVVILLAGLLLGWKSALSAALLSILYGVILIQADSRGLLPDPFNYSSNTYVALNGIFFTITGAIFVLLHQTVEEALRRVKNELDERIHAEQDLLQFRKVMDASNDAIFIVDPESSRYIDFNRTAHERLGYSREELGSLGVMDIAEQITSLKGWQKRVNLVRDTGG
ncbi:MAG TPA: PAS domain-containing protein, partial [Anaerolineales bacterium]|nr:PAS domain-containing protein [Anaerolineales bacterium]